MRKTIISICLLSVFAANHAAAQAFHWDGGDLQFAFTDQPHQQREPTINQDELKVLNQVVALIKQKREQDAITELKRQLSRTPSAALWFSLAQLQQQQNDPAAVSSLKQALTQLPQFTRAHQALGSLLTQQGDFLAARPHLQQAAAQGAPASIYAMLGYGYLQDQQFQAAKAAYSQALMLAGDHPQWQRGLLHAAMAAKDDPLAYSLTEQLLQTDPTDPQLHQLRANLALRQQNWPEVIASLEIAQRLKPSSSVQWQLAQIYLDQGYYLLAQPHLQQLLAKGIKGREQRLLEIADFLIMQQQVKQARLVLDKLLASKSLTDHQRSHGLTSKARALAQTGANPAPSQQQKALEQALKLDPLNGQALIALAGLQELTQPAEAEMLYRRAATLPSVQLEALQRHAQFLLTQEAYRRAEQLLQQAVNYAPEHRQLRDNLAIVSRMVQSQG